MLDTEFDEEGNAIVKKEPPKSARQLRRGDTINEALYNLNNIISQRKQAKAEKLKKDEDAKIQKAQKSAVNSQSSVHTG